MESTKESSFLNVSNGILFHAVNIEKDRLLKSQSYGNSFGVVSAEIGTFYLMSALCCIEILSGNFKQVKERTNSIEKNLKLASYSSKAQYLAVQSHTEIKSGNYQAALDRIEAMLGLFEKIHCDNSVFIALILSILALRNVAEMTKRESSQLNKRRGSRLDAFKGSFHYSSFRSKPSSPAAYANEKLNSPFVKLTDDSLKLSPESSIKTALPPLPLRLDAIRNSSSSAGPSPPISFRKSRQKPAESIIEDVELDGILPKTKFKESKARTPLNIVTTSNDIQTEGPKSSPASSAERNSITSRFIQESKVVNSAAANESEPRKGKRSSGRGYEFPKPKLEDNTDFPATKEYLSAVVPEGSLYITLKTEELALALKSPIGESSNPSTPAEFSSKRATYRRMSSLVGIRSPVPVPVQDYTFRIKFLLKQLIEKATLCQAHICAEPMILVLKAQLKSLEHGAAETAMMLADGPEALRKWIKELTKPTEVEMKLFLGLALIACSRLAADPQEYSVELKKGKMHLDQMGIVNFFE